MPDRALGNRPNRPNRPDRQWGGLAHAQVVAEKLVCTRTFAVTLTRILHEKRDKARRDREPERFVKPEPDNSVIAVRILQIYTAAGSLRFERGFMQYPG